MKRHDVRKVFRMGYRRPRDKRPKRSWAVRDKVSRTYVKEDILTVEEARKQCNSFNFLVRPTFQSVVDAVSKLAAQRRE